MNIKYTLLLAAALSATAASAQKKKAPIKKKAVPASTMSPRVKALYDDMLQNTQMVFIIDSTVVDADKVVDAIPLPKAYGKYIAYNTFFGTTSEINSNSYVYVNGWGNRCYYNEVGTDSISRLYMREKQGDAWTEARALTEINESYTNASCPYMASDGQTLYFAGTSQEDGLGKRDIYMTKYDADEGKFLKAENLGLPFNSTSDDFMYVEADADSMAWFATSRRQPEGKVCIYTFVPSATRHNYDADEMTESELKSHAAITRIRETWPTPEIRQAAMQRLERIKRNAETQNRRESDIEFVVNDAVTYTALSDFKSADTRNAYADIRMKQNDADKQAKEIDALRIKYHDAKTAEKDALGRKIALAEQKLKQTNAAIDLATKALRQNENKLLKR